MLNKKQKLPLNQALKKNRDLTAVFLLLVFLSFVMLTLQFLMIGYDVDLAVARGSEVVFAAKSNLFQFPVEALATALIAYVIIISGANVGRSFLKIGVLPETADQSTSEVPEWKIRQIFVFLWILATLAVYATVLQLMVGSDILDFGVSAWYNTVISTALSYAALRAVPKVAEGVYIKIPEDMKGDGKPKEKKEKKKSKLSDEDIENLR